LNSPIIQNLKDTPDIRLALDAGHLLEKTYPGYIWQVRLNDSILGGVLEIHNITIQDQLYTHTNYGTLLKLSTIYADPGMKCVIQAGGEILERAGLSRIVNTGDPVKSVEGVPLDHQPIVHQLKTLGIIS
jgi:hypothetical protein